MNHDEELETLGLLCPLPVLKAAKRLRSMPAGAVLKLVADDPAAVIDVPHFCAPAMKMCSGCIGFFEGFYAVKNGCPLPGCTKY